MMKCNVPASRGRHLLLSDVSEFSMAATQEQSLGIDHRRREGQFDPKLVVAVSGTLLIHKVGDVIGDSYRFT